MIIHYYELIHFCMDIIENVYDFEKKRKKESALFRNQFYQKPVF